MHRKGTQFADAQYVGRSGLRRAAGAGRGLNDQIEAFVAAERAQPRAAHIELAVLEAHLHVRNQVSDVAALPGRQHLDGPLGSRPAGADDAAGWPWAAAEKARVRDWRTPVGASR